MTSTSVRHFASQWPLYYKHQPVKRRLMASYRPPLYYTNGQLLLHCCHLAFRRPTLIHASGCCQTTLFWAKRLTFNVLLKSGFQTQNAQIGYYFCLYVIYSGCSKSIFTIAGGSAVVSPQGSSPKNIIARCALCFERKATPVCRASCVRFIQKQEIKFRRFVGMPLRH